MTSPEWTLTQRPLRTTRSAGLRPVATSTKRGATSLHGFGFCCTLCLVIDDSCLWPTVPSLRLICQRIRRRLSRCAVYLYWAAARRAGHVGRRPCAAGADEQIPAEQTMVVARLRILRAGRRNRRV